MEELVNQMSCTPDDYKNLQIFLHRDREINYHSETEYLLVSPSCFGKVRLSNLSVDNNFIIIEFVECLSQEVGFVRVKIYEENPSTFFINWNDVKSLVSTDVSTFFDDSGLLEFDF